MQIIIDVISRLSGFRVVKIVSFFHVVSPYLSPSLKLLDSLSCDLKKQSCISMFDLEQRSEHLSLHFLLIIDLKLHYNRLTCLAVKPLQFPIDLLSVQLSSLLDSLSYPNPAWVAESRRRPRWTPASQRDDALRSERMWQAEKILG